MAAVRLQPSALGKPFVEITSKDGKLRAGLEQAKAKLNQFAEGSKKAFTAFGGSGLIGDLLGGVGGLGGLAGVTSILGPGGLLATGLTAGVVALSQMETAAERLNKQLAETRTIAVALRKTLTELQAADLSKAAGQPTRDEQRAAFEKELEFRQRQLENAEKSVKNAEERRARATADLSARDNAGTRAELDAANLALEQAQSNRGTAASLLAKAEEAAAQARERATATIKQQTQEMRESNETFGMTADAVARYKAALDGVPAAVLAAHEAEAKRKAQLEDGKAVMADAVKQAMGLKQATDTLTESLRLQVEMFGKSAEEAQIAAQKRAGATEEELAEARKLAAELERLRNRDEAVKRAFRDMFGGKGEAPKVTFGTSQGAFSGPLRQILGGSALDKKQVTELEKANGYLKTIAEKRGGVFG